MLPYRIFAMVAAALCGLLLTGFSKDDLRRDMVSLDKVYIAALALTSQGKVAESRKAVAALDVSWRTFRDGYYNANPSDSQWKADFDAVGGMVGEAVKIASSSAPINDAHEALEHVREVMMKLRRRNGIEYFIDGLTAFHEPMELIVLAAKDKSGDTLTDADVARIGKSLPQAAKAWQDVAGRNLDGTTYRLSAAQVEQARGLMAKQTAALDELKSALAAGDRPRIAAAAPAIKPNFAQLFMTFGDFAPYRQ